MATHLHVAKRRGLSSVKLAEEDGMRQVAVWYLQHRIRGTCAEMFTLCKVIAEANENLVGGLEKNRHAPK